MPVRFHYAKVESSSYNLDAAEILMATDAELNSYMSLRKLAPYRSEEEKKGKSKKRLKELRDALKGRKWGEEIDEDREREEAERYGKRVKWSEISKANMLPTEGEEQSNPVEEAEGAREFKSIKVPIKDTTGTARRNQVAQDGPAKRVGKKERERRKAAAALASVE